MFVDLRRRFSQISQLEAGQEHPQRLRVLCAIKTENWWQKPKKINCLCTHSLKIFSLIIWILV